MKPAVRITLDRLRKRVVNQRARLSKLQTEYDSLLRHHMNALSQLNKIRLESNDR